MITTVAPRPWAPTSAAPGPVTDRFPATRPFPAPIDPPTERIAVTRGAAPSATSRLRGVDAARGLALLGMIAAHALPLTDGDQPSMVGRVVNGPAAALFGVLAGLSVALLTGRR